MLGCRSLFVLIGESTAGESQQRKLSLEELMVSTLAMTDALAKLLIEKRRDHRL